MLCFAPQKANFQVPRSLSSKTKVHEIIAVARSRLANLSRNNATIIARQCMFIIDELAPHEKPSD